MILRCDISETTEREGLAEPGSLHDCESNRVFLRSKNRKIKPHGFYLRRERDLNPRYPSGYIRLPIVHLRPLGHLSRNLFSYEKLHTCGEAYAYRSRGDSNPRYLTAQRFSRPPPSTTRTPLLWMIEIYITNAHNVKVTL